MEATVMEWINSEQHKLHAEQKRMTNNSAENVT